MVTKLTSFKVTQRIAKATQTELERVP